LAIQERRRLALGIAPIPSINALLEHEGVKVRARSFPAGSQVSGCYVFAPELGLCVLINQNHPSSRRRFTGAHEYAHFLVDRNNVQAFICSLQNSQELIEMRANAFAAAFLLPGAGLEARLQELGADRGEVEAEHVVHLMFDFGASYEAVLWRLLNLGWINKGDRDRLAARSWAGVGRVLGYENREPGDTESEPDRFRSVAIEAWRADEISLAKLAELLNLPRAEVQQALPPAEITQPRPARAPAAEPDWL
jgi:Zn-dependent peptidase ImmA (M78 family)